MSSQESLVIVPGIGDRIKPQAKQLPVIYGLYGLQVLYIDPGWRENDFKPRFQHTKERVKNLLEDGKSVNLMGISGGASYVLNLFAEYPEVNTVVSVCGKINHPEKIGPEWFKPYPNFEQSMARLPASLDKIDDAMRQRVLNVIPEADEVVEDPSDGVLEGGRKLVIPTYSHAYSIAYAHTVGNQPIARHIQQPR